MPTFSFKTRTRTVSENCTLDLVVQHRLVAGKPSDTLLVKEGPPPQSIGTILVSPLAVTISGMLNGTRILPEQLKSSCIAQHLPEYLRMNSKELGMESVSDPCIAEDTGLLTFICTASWPTWSTNIQIRHLKLLGFDIDYIWHENSLSTFPAIQDITLTPFSRHLALPFLAALNNAVDRFASQAVRRYPRVFGSWGRQLDRERGHIPSLFTSLRNILNRSSNLAFQTLFDGKMKLLGMSISNSFASAEDALSNYLGIAVQFDVGGSEPPLHKNDMAFMLAMERIYSLAQKLPTFKTISSSRRLRCKDDGIDDQRITTDGRVNFNEGPHFTNTASGGRPRSHELIGLRGQLLSNNGSGDVGLDSDLSMDFGYGNSPGRGNDGKQFWTSKTYLAGHPSSKSLRPERSSSNLDIHLDVDHVRTSRINVTQYHAEEALFLFAGDCSPNVKSSLNTSTASAALAPFLEDINMFDTETSEWQLPSPSRLSPMCNRRSAGARNTASLSISSRDTMSSDEDLLGNNQHAQAISDLVLDISAGTSSGFDFAHDTSGFNFTAIDHEAAQSPSQGCVSGVIPVTEPSLPRGVDDSGLHIPFHDTGELYCYNICNTLDDTREMDFIAMDFGL